MDLFYKIMFILFILVFLIAYIRITKVIDIIIVGRIRFLHKQLIMQKKLLDQLLDRIEQLEKNQKQK